MKKYIKPTTLVVELDAKAAILGAASLNNEVVNPTNQLSREGNLWDDGDMNEEQ